jgi:23S rRNA (uridine2552-2'-O)-methyltransferase
VVDLGCWPGSWLEEAARAVGAQGRVVGLDLVAIEPPIANRNVEALVGDMTEPVSAERILESLGGPCDVLLSDAAPKLSGVRERDDAAEEYLLLAVEALNEPLLKKGGDLLIKLLECPEAQAFQQRLRARYSSVKTVKSAATRKGSRERYLLARGFYGADVIE